MEGCPDLSVARVGDWSADGDFDPIGGGLTNMGRIARGGPLAIRSIVVLLLFKDCSRLMIFSLD